MKNIDICKTQTDDQNLNPNKSIQADSSSFRFFVFLPLFLGIAHHPVIRSQMGHIS